MLSHSIGFNEMIIIVVIAGGLISIGHKIVEAVAENAKRKRELEKDYLVQMLHDIEAIKRRLDARDSQRTA